jgi:hypothetical protein
MASRRSGPWRPEPHKDEKPNSYAALLSRSQQGCGNPWHQAAGCIPHQIAVDRANCDVIAFVCPIDTIDHRSIALPLRLPNIPFGINYALFKH